MVSTISVRYVPMNLKMELEQAAHYFGNVSAGWQGPGMIVPQMVWMPQDGHDIEGRPTVSFRPGVSLGRALQMGPGQGFDMPAETTPRNRARFTLRIQVCGVDMLRLTEINFPLVAWLPIVEYKH